MAVENRRLPSVINQDGGVILDIECGLISTLNSTGAYVWNGIQSGESLETITANLVRETGEEARTVERDVREFVEDLKQKSLLPK